MKNSELPSPTAMSPGESAGEIATILAAVISRSYAAADPEAESEFGLAIVPTVRVHTTPYQEKELS